MQSGCNAPRTQLPPENELARSAGEKQASGEWNSEQLFGSLQEVGIRHEGHLYRLRRTKLGKLILTK